MHKRSITESTKVVEMDNINTEMERIRDHDGNKASARGQAWTNGILQEENQNKRTKQVLKNTIQVSKIIRHECTYFKGLSQTRDH